MKSLKWMEDYKPGILVKVQESVFNKVSHFLDDLTEYVEQTPIELFNPDGLEKLHLVIW